LVSGLIGGAVGAFAGSQPASAHNELLKTVPASGAQVATPPTTVQLVFGETARAKGSSITVTDPSGATVSTGALAVVDATVTQPVQITVAGAYTVKWQVISADGDPVNGTFTFTVTAVPAAASPSAAASESPSPSTAAATSAEASPSVTAAASSTTDSGGNSIVWWIVGGVVVLAAAAAIAVLARRRRATAS
jgi:methionine-rich copper-binding protein CopC